MRGTEKADMEELSLEKKDGFSEYSSGCQSGWTVYLDHSQQSPTTSRPRIRETSAYKEEEEEEEEEEEDLSMLTDASSGPPHFEEDDYTSTQYSYNEEDDCLCSGSSLSLAVFDQNGAKRRRVVEEKQQEHSSTLHDTAISPLLCFSKAVCTSKKFQVEDTTELTC